MYRSEAGFPSLATIDIWDQILLCCSGHHRMFEPIFSFYPVMPVSYVLRCVNSVFRHWHMSPGSNFIFLSWFREFLTAELSIFSWALSRHSKLLCCRDHQIFTVIFPPVFFFNLSEETMISFFRCIVLTQLFST